MTVEGVALGPFVLRSLLGRGAAGEVFLAEHRGQNVEVAVKVLSRRGGWEPKHLSRFRTEVNAMASLHHHGVVMVLDYGEIDAGVAADTGNRLTEGSPYFAMELARYGSLHGAMGQLNFQSIRSILLVILESLAHAHAHGLIHRDIKPANVLVFGQTPGRPDLKLTDFGIVLAAADREREGFVENSMGTPQYMAPEQFRGLWRDYGPWTDLYGVGCVAYELATGEVPFDADTFMEHAYNHTRLDRPPLPNDGRFPAAFQDWLERVMHIEPQHRFQRAADAAWALRQIVVDYDPDQPILPHLPLRTFDMSLPLDAAQTSLGTDPSLPWSLVTVSGELGALARAVRKSVRRTTDEMDHSSVLAAAKSVGGTRSEDVPPMHVTWRTETPPRRSIQLLGAGLGIYDVRTVPFVGREVERDLIWRTLRATGETGRPHMLAVVGAAGVGKSRLARWMCERAHELGVASPLLAVHDRNPGPTQGLARMLARNLRCVGLQLGETMDRVSHLFGRYGPTGDAYLVRALVSFMLPQGRTGHLRLGQREESFEALLSWMRYRARSRPLIVWLDDVQWGRDALEFVDHVMRAEGSAPIFFLLTAREEALAGREVEREKLEEIQGFPASSCVQLGPLPADANAVLVEDLLGMETDLAKEVESRAGGNPMFAIELVGDWVQRGVLTVGEAGFMLREGERAALPDDLYGLAGARLQFALDGKGEEVRRALEIAAILGRRFDNGEWLGLCEMCGVTDAGQFARQLIEFGVLVEEERGFVFAHGVVAESLERSSREAAHWASHHRVCADILLNYSARSRGFAQRVARHFLEAQEDESALAPLLESAEELMQAGQYGEAIDALLMRDVAIEGLRYPGSDVTRSQSRVLRARILVLQGVFEEAKGILLDLVDRHGSDSDAGLQVRARALQCLGDIARIRGEWMAARTYYRTAMGHFESRRHLPGQWETLSGMAEVEAQTGALRTAETFYRRVQEIGRTLGDSYPVAVALLGLGRVAFQGDCVEESIDLLHRARRSFEGLGARSPGTDCLHALGDVARVGGNLDDAARNYGTALGFYEAIGSGLAVHVRLSQALLHLDRGEYLLASDQLAVCLRVFGSTGERDDLGRAHAVLLACAACREDWEGYDAHFHEATEHLRATQRADRDIAHCFALAAQYAHAAGHESRANWAREFVATQQALLGMQRREERP